MSDAVETYDAAFKSMNEANAALRKIHQPIDDVLSSLRKHPDKLSFAGEQNPGGGAAPYDRKAIKLSDWPNADQLRSLVNNWKNARLALLQAWDAVPQERRGSLRTPEEAPGGGRDPAYRGY